LFTGTPHDGEARSLAAQQRAPVVLEADVEAVIRTLQQFDA